METLMDDILKLAAERRDKQEVSAIQNTVRKLAMLPIMEWEIHLLCAFYSRSWLKA